MRIKKLLLELDPRKDNQAALERAQSIATSFDADIDVVVCQPPPVYPGAVPTQPAVLAVAQQDYRSEVEEWARVKSSDLVEAGLAVNVIIADELPRYEAILGQAEATGADLIIRVVGERGRLERLFLGTTDWDLIRHAKQPLWLVRSDGTGRKSNNVMAAIDPLHPKDEHMKLDKQLLRFADGLSKAMNGSMHVYHSYQTPPMAAVAPEVDPEMLGKVESLHKASVDELVSEYGLPTDQVHLVEGDPAAEIDDVIGANGIGVVVAGAVSRSWLDRLLVGSTAESLLDAVTCDLVLLKAGS